MFANTRLVLSMILILPINKIILQKHSFLVDCCEEDKHTKTSNDDLYKKNENPESKELFVKYTNSPIDTPNAIFTRQTTVEHITAPRKDDFSKITTGKCQDYTYIDLNNHLKQNPLETDLKESVCFLVPKINSNYLRTDTIPCKSWGTEYPIKHNKCEGNACGNRINSIMHKEKTQHSEIRKIKKTNPKVKENFFFKKVFIENYTKNRTKNTPCIPYEEKLESQITCNKSSRNCDLHRIAEETLEPSTIKKAIFSKCCTNNIENNLCIDPYSSKTHDNSETYSDVVSLPDMLQQSDTIIKTVSRDINYNEECSFYPVSITDDPFVFQEPDLKIFYVDFGIQDHGAFGSLNNKLLDSPEQGYFKIKTTTFYEKNRSLNQCFFKKLCIIDVPVFFSSCFLLFSEKWDVKEITGTSNILSFYKNIDIQARIPFDLDVKMISILPILKFTFDSLFFSTYYTNKIRNWKYKTKKITSPFTTKDINTIFNKYNDKENEKNLNVNLCFEKNETRFSAILESLDAIKNHHDINKETSSDNVNEILKKLGNLKRHLKEMDELNFSVSNLKIGILKISYFNNHFLTNGKELLSRGGNNFIEINLIGAYKDLYRKLRIFSNSIFETYNRYLRKASEERITYF
ncbi:hypothetical protein CDIK_0685 [Cucumispora dikerogammari]|nr:hypothetical protein CDIK_0685 [Cucumispora dikerogammari]